MSDGMTFQLFRDLEEIIDSLRDEDAYEYHSDLQIAWGLMAQEVITELYKYYHDNMDKFPEIRFNISPGGFFSYFVR